MMLSRALGHDKVAAVADKWSTPTYTEDIADWLEALAASDAPAGIYHLSNAGSCNWREYAEHALKCAAAQGLPVKTTKVAPLSLKDMEAFIAERPIHTVLSTQRFSNLLKIQPRPWQEAVRDYIRDHPPC
jgi:dTDP-4-dehydrorhamnose reductase